MSTVFNELFTSIKKQLGVVIGGNQKILAKLEEMEKHNDEIPSIKEYEELKMENIKLSRDYEQMKSFLTKLGVKLDFIDHIVPDSVHMWSYIPQFDFAYSKRRVRIEFDVLER